MPDENEKKEIAPKVQADAGSGDGDFPPRKTAVGAGGNDDSELNAEDWQRVQNEHHRTGEPIPVILMRLGLNSSCYLKNFLERKFGVNYVALNSVNVDAECTSILTQQFARQYQVAAFHKDGKRLSLAMINPNDIRALDAVKALITGVKIKPFVCTEENWRRYMDNLPPQKVTT